MKRPDADTIAAIGTAAGGGIGIIRISGPDAIAIAGRIFRGRGGRQLEAAAPFLLVLGTVTEPTSREPIDEALAVHMPEGHSYTGESTVEIQAHGGRVVLDSVLSAALRAGARQAEPGEFTKRAFLSGRLDLTQAEAVAEIISAESEEARRRALDLLQGAVADRVKLFRERLLDFVARVEAALDFEEEDVPGDLPSASDVISLCDDIRSLSARAGEKSGATPGIRVALAGRPNSGKSSIFNYLLNFKRSIVAPFPGTTRDYIEEHSLIGGVSATLVDTAGLRATTDVVESEGVRRSIQRIDEADIVVLVFDGSEPDHPDDAWLFELAAGRAPIVVISKADLPQRRDRRENPPRTHGSVLFALSTITGEGFSGFTAALASRCLAAARPVVAGESILNTRHREVLERVTRYLESAAEHGREGDGLIDQMAMDLRAALIGLGEVTGETATEDILDRIFSKFCVGK